MISCNCGDNNFQIMEEEDKAKIICAGCGRIILETKKENLNLTGFKKDAE